VMAANKKTFVRCEGFSLDKWGTDHTGCFIR